VEEADALSDRIGIMAYGKLKCVVKIFFKKYFKGN
jgi:hypothetical protein